MCPRPTRRDLLRGGAATLAASTAGCLSALPPLGGAQTYGRVDVPASDPPDYRRWLPAPDSGEDYAFVAARPGAVDAGDPEGGRLRVRHAAGDAVDAADLWADVDTESRSGEVEKTALFPDRDRVGPGDEGTVDLRSVEDPIHASVVLIPDPEDTAFRVLFTYGLE